MISSGNFDLVHCDNLPICYTVRHRKDIYRSVTDHDVSYLKCLSMARKEKNFLLKIFMLFEASKLKRLEKKIFKQVDLGIVVSELDRSNLKKLCPEGNFLVVENGVDIDKFQPVSEMQEQSKLLWLGGFGHLPNKQGIIFFLNEVYPMVKNEVPSVSIDIIGGGITHEIKQLAQRDSSVNLIGYVDDPLPFMHKATVFVAPVFIGGGTKLKVLEAMAVGKAIVTTSVGCEGIGGVPGQHYLVADDSHRFAFHVAKLMSDKSLRASLQINARKLVIENYNFDEICKKLDEYYRRELHE